jgi:Xaa-Pro dipeptidase
VKILTKISLLQQKMLKQDKMDFLVIFNNVNLTYFTGFSGATALLIPKQGEGTLYVSAVNYEQAKTETKGLAVDLLKRGENLMQKIAAKTAPNKLAMDSLSIESWRSLAKAVGGEEKLETTGNLIRELRSVKDPDEVKLIREACNLAEIGMQVAFETVKPGVTERRVAAEVEYAMRKKGADGTSFDTIIASGISSAFPHGSCTNRTIHQGDLVVVDLGATYQSYRSDMTRTFTAGKSTEKQMKIYETVKIAQQKAFKAISPNISAAQVDGAARRAIEAAGFGEFFVHNLGHGVGLEIHEAPILSPDSKDTLAAGNVVTDEPGIYLPGYGGVRIEDTVFITSNGAERLTTGYYSLETLR